MHLQFIEKVVRHSFGRCNLVCKKMHVKLMPNGWVSAIVVKYGSYVMVQLREFLIIVANNSLLGNRQLVDINNNFVLKSVEWVLLW